MNNEEKILATLDLLVAKIDKLEQGQAELRQGQIELRREQAELRQGQIELRREQTELRQEIRNISSQQKENTALIRALVHASEITKAEHEGIQITLAEVEGNLAGLNKKINLIEIVSSNNWNEIARIKAIN